MLCFFLFCVLLFVFAFITWNKSRTEHPENRTPEKIMVHVMNYLKFTLSPEDSLVKNRIFNRVGYHYYPILLWIGRIIKFLPLSQLPVQIFGLWRIWYEYDYVTLSGNRNLTDTSTLLFSWLNTYQQDYLGRLNFVTWDFRSSIFHWL